MSTSSKAVIKTSTMSVPMQDAAVQCAHEAIRSSDLEKEVASCIKSAFDSLYPNSVWQCFVGRNFGSYVSHEQSKFIYFYVSNSTSRTS
jgi:dynein light chain LC8-type